MTYITFFWDTWAIFGDKKIFRMIQREDYKGKTWQECCDESARCWDWDNSDFIKGFENNVIETNRQLKQIIVKQNGEELEASNEIYVYYKNRVEKLKRDLGDGN